MHYLCMKSVVVKPRSTSEAVIRGSLVFNTQPHATHSVYRIVTEGEVTMANSTRGRLPKGSVSRSSRPVVTI